MKNKILNYYAFKEDEDGDLFCVLEDGSELIFRFFSIGNAVDLLLRKAPSLKEESLILSFSFDNDSDKKILNEWYSKKKN